ncbi:MAG: transcription-repair coupling factor [Deltaproteobacteria bacterium]|nr:MAG: transcription-repair coupling factor [Deltaproteobacteria bacterium]
MRTVPGVDDSLHHLTQGLARANARFPEALRALAEEERVDFSGLPPGAAAMLLARAAPDNGGGTIVVTADLDAARRTCADLAFFLGGDRDQVLLYPSSDITPYLDVAPDRRAAMDRLAVLFHLAQGLPWKFLVVPAAALIRRVAPRAAVEARSTVVTAEEELDRDAFIRILAEGGYLRVPVAEDPGTFAVRGGILDVYPPHASYPARIELDDWLVLSIKHFDPDDQKTIEEVRQIFVHPVRDTMLGPDEIALARERVRDLCDAVDLPTSRTRALIEDIESGRAFYGIDGFLPAFHENLETLFDYCAPETPTVILDPTAVIRAVVEEREAAKGDRGAKHEDGSPSFEVGAHYLDGGDLMEALSERPLAVVHRLAVGGAPADEEDDEAGPLRALETVDLDAVMNLGGVDHAGLIIELKTRRGMKGGGDALAPLATRTRGWLEAGLRVVFAARTDTQARRLGKVLAGYDVATAKAVPLTPERLKGKPTGKVEILIGSLGDGFVLSSEALAVVTEEEVFGSRAHRAKPKRRKKADRAAFLEDLRELSIGDYVVHIDHGIGQYIGLQRKALGQSQLDRMHGKKAAEVEVLVVEYSTGDKLFLPVTRLNQIQKYASKEGKKPKIDKLGGQSFAKTKARVKKRVRKLADELLRLYAQRAAARRDPLPPAGRDYAEFEATFPFEETPDQARAIDEILSDLEGPRPMDRVVCGDVGFGKTEVAMRAAFRVAMNGGQVAVLCPTTVLAQQHFQTFRDRLADYPIEVRTLSRFVDKTLQAENLTKLKDGTADIIIGTHRLLSKDVHFKDLRLLVVDEEQRFGVAHKERIKALRTEVDVLTLSATPIPRTLQMSIGGLRDLSLITTAPVDRRAVRTFVSRWDDRVIAEALRRELARGGQAFFVYNRVEGLYERANKLQQLLPEGRFGVAHGQMKEGELERVMTDFVEGRFDVLCATAIIESGLDIPRANTIIVDRADIFGLSQLYQIRGRVGRSKERAYCYLLTPPPSRMTDEARSRIEALERFTELGSGFHVASLDMEIRGAGDLLGGEQSGAVTQVGLDIFLHMLEEAIAQLRGEPVVHEVDPEINVDLEVYLPEEYIDDVGLRLSFYKRLASAEDEQVVHELGTEMEDRFGRTPRPATALLRSMALKPALRALRALGCEATSTRVTLHLKEDTPLDPAKVMSAIAASGGALKLSPTMKLTRRFGDQEKDGDSIERIDQLLTELAPMLKDDR